MKSSLGVLALFAFLSIPVVDRTAVARAAEATTGVIVGTVATREGAPIAHATVSASSASGRYVALTNAQGRFAMLGVAPGSYIISAEAPGYEPVTTRDLRVLPGQEQHVSFTLAPQLRNIASVRASAGAFTVGSTSDKFTVSGEAALAQFPTTSSAGLASYSQGSVQGAIANVPGVDLDSFGNAVLRAGRVSDAAFEYNSVVIPQGLIAEPGGNVDGAQLPTTGIASTSVTLAGYSNESDNALGGVVNQIPAVGTYPGRATFEAGLAAGTQYQFANLQILGATPDLKWRYALASTLGSEYFQYGNGTTFYPSEAGTYGLALQSRGQYSVESNVHDLVTPKDDVSILALVGQATYNQYGSPFAGETVGQFNGPTTSFPGSTNPNAPVDYSAGVRGNFDVLMAQWQHTSGLLLSRLQLYQTQYGSSAGGPFWDENGFPDGSISLSEVSAQRQNGVNLDNEGLFGPHHVLFGAEFRANTSYLDQVVPTADEFITSNPTIVSYLVYLGDRWAASNRLELMGTARITNSHVMPSDGFAYDAGAIDPHFGASYRLGTQYALRANYDRITVAPAPLEADRTDSTNLDQNGNPAPFVPLAPETANDFTYSFEGGGRTQFRLTYYQKFEKDLIDVLPFNFRSEVAAGLNPTGVGVPTNVGQLHANGLELYLKNGGFAFDGNLDPRVLVERVTVCVQRPQRSRSRRKSPLSGQLRTRFHRRAFLRVHGCAQTHTNHALAVLRDRLSLRERQNGLRLQSRDEQADPGSQRQLRQPGGELLFPCEPVGTVQRADESLHRKYGYERGQRSEHAAFDAADLREPSRRGNDRAAPHRHTGHREHLGELLADGVSEQSLPHRPAGL